MKNICLLLTIFLSTNINGSTLTEPTSIYYKGRDTNKVAVQLDEDELDKVKSECGRDNNGDDDDCEGLEDERIFYTEPSSIYHAAFKRGIFFYENGWNRTYDFYEQGSSFDENDGLRHAYSKFLFAINRAYNTQFRNYDATISTFHAFKDAIDCFNVRSNGLDHPLLAFMYLEWLSFINKHTVSSQVSVICLGIDNIICYLESRWKTRKDIPDDAMAFLQTENFKIRSMLYGLSANSLLKKIQGVNAEERANLTKRREEDLTLSEQSLHEAQERAQSDKQKEHVERHWGFLERERNKQDQKTFSQRTTRYLENLNTYLKTDSSYVRLLDEKLESEVIYLGVMNTSRSWFKPIVNVRQVEHQTPQTQQEQTEQKCLCDDCRMIRDELDRCADLIFSDIDSQDHFNFTINNLVNSMFLFRDYKDYLDQEGKQLLLDITNEVLSWGESLHPDVRGIFQSANQAMFSFFNSGVGRVDVNGGFMSGGY